MPEWQARSVRDAALKGRVKGRGFEVRNPDRPRVPIDSTPPVPTGVGEQMSSYMIVTALE